MRSRRLLPLLAVVALLAGCGGGGRLDEQQYQAQATGICQQLQRDQRALSSPRQPAQIKGYLGRLLDVTQNALGRLRAIKPPEQRQQAYDAALGARQQTLDRLRQIQGQLKGDRSDLVRLQQAGGSGELQRLSQSENAKFRAAGLPACAR